MVIKMIEKRLQKLKDLYSDSGFVEQDFRQFASISRQGERFQITPEARPQLDQFRIAEADQVTAASWLPVDFHLGKGFQASAETLLTFARRFRKAFETAMIWSQEGDNAIGFAVIGMVEDDGR